MFLGAAVYTVFGLLWGVVAVLSVRQELRGLLLLGLAAVLALLLGQTIYLVRGAAMFPVEEAQTGPALKPLRTRTLIVLVAGELVIMLVVALWLKFSNHQNWLATATACVFCLHFYLLPSRAGLWADALLASTALLFVLVTPFRFPDSTWLWALAAAVVCALACWLAADLRLQHAKSILTNAQERNLDAASGEY